MESPVKKLQYDVEDKENKPLDDDAIATLVKDVDANETQTVVEAKKVEETPKAVANTKADVEDEPLLQENPNRFVLFPIKYHEVRVPDASRRVKWFC